MSTEACINRQLIRGMYFPCSSVFTKDNIKSALDFKPLDGDIIISTYPKTGTTWIQYIIYEILKNGQEPPSITEMRAIIPYMEASGTSITENLDQPRAVKFHLPYNLVPKNPSAKYITMIRNPYDVVVSYYHFLKQITNVNLKFDDLFEAFVKGECIYGDYFDHILSWYEHRNDENVLVLSYERMKRNPKEGLLLIAQFLGCNLSGNEQLIERILRYTSFDYMKEKLNSMENRDSQNEHEVNFFRKGMSGYGVSQLTEDQKKILSDRILEKCRDSDIASLWT